MVRFVVAMTVLAAIAGPLVAQEAQPWETWQPPQVTLPAPNGFDTYLKAFELKERVDAQFPRDEDLGDEQPPDRWAEGPADLALPDRVALYASVLKLVRVALTQETRIPAPESLTEPMPYMAGFRAVARLLAMEAEVHCIEGDYLGAANSALDGLAMARDASSQRTLISYLVGTACEAISLRSLDETIPDLKAGEYKQVLARLLQIESTRLPLTETLDGEEICARMELQTISKASAQQQRDMAEEWGRGAAEFRKMVDGISPQSWQAIGESYQILRQIAAMPYFRRPKQLPQPEDVFAKLIMPPGDRVLFKHAQALTALHLHEAELATRAYLLEKMQLPADLQALVPGYLAEVPSDPFGEGPLRAAFTGQKPCIYSIGPDMKDDGGTPLDTPFPAPASKGDIVTAVPAKP